MKPKKTKSNGQPSKKTPSPGAGAGAGHILGAFAGDGYSLIVGGEDGKSHLPHVAGAFGDITGNQGAGGGAGRKLRKARAVGVGDDLATKLANEFAAWAASSPGRAVMASGVQADASAWAALQAFAQRAAQRAAKRVIELRGVRPSQSSIDDAQADAIASMAGKFPAGCLKPRNLTGARLRILSKYAGRGAFRSLCAWAVKGMTGDNAQWTWDKAQVASAAGMADGATAKDKAKSRSANRWLVTGRNIEVASLTDELRDTLAAEDSRPLLSELPVRGAMARWVFRVGVRDFASTLAPDMRGAARAQALDGARRRCRVVAAVILGASVADALIVAGYSSGAAFDESCAKSGLWQALSSARAVQSQAGADVQRARAFMRSHARKAILAARVMRRATDAGPVITAQPGVRLARVAYGPARMFTPAGVNVNGALLAGVGTVVPSLFTRQIILCGTRGTGAAYRGLWARAATARARHMDQAIHWRNVAQAATRADAAAWGKVADGLHADKFADLRHVFGTVDSKGRVRNGSKLDSSARRSGNGKVQRAARLAPVVELDVRTRYGVRQLACAPLSAV